MVTLNQKVFQFIYNFGGRGTFLSAAAIFFAQYLPYLLILGFLILAYYQKGWRRKVYVFCEGALAVILSRGLITEIIRFFYHHQRPFSFYGFNPLIPESGWSFPSGHAAWFFALAMVVWYTNRKWGWWFFALTILMGIARIYAGVHWPADVLAGAVVGIGSALLIHWALKRSREGLQKGA
jgi:undecaprenyl-diphosphatase